MSRTLIIFVIVVNAFSFAAASVMGWRAALVIFPAAALFVAWSIVWRRHLGHKWRLEQGRAG